MSLIKKCGEALSCAMRSEHCVLTKMYRVNKCVIGIKSRSTIHSSVTKIYVTIFCYISIPGSVACIFLHLFDLLSTLCFGKLSFPKRDENL